MTREELLEMLARALFNEECGTVDSYDSLPDSVKEQYVDLANAVIKALTPMMSEVVVALYKTKKKGVKWHPCSDEIVSIDKALASLECFVTKG
jgi:hypothetical protein